MVGEDYDGERTQGGIGKKKSYIRYFSLLCFLICCYWDGLIVGDTIRISHYNSAFATRGGSVGRKEEFFAHQEIEKIGVGGRKGIGNVEI